MRVRVSLDFDILIESFISLCIMETVGAICREYKPWIVLLIKIDDNRRVLYDQVFSINYRCNYLRKIKSFREAGYDIMYMDET
jgi:hypothetical protein